MVVKLNLGSGKNLKKGYVNVDLYVDSAEVQHDLNIYPYPFEDNSVDFISASHIVEHLKEPMDFFLEIQRILKVGGRALIVCPHVEATGGAFGAMDHRHFFHETAIDTITGTQISMFKKNPLKLLKTTVKKGRFMFWQKREIYWLIKKV
jgi:predicted SAM-dependent methyltransferase